MILGKSRRNQDTKRKRTLAGLNWTKKNIFFELEYWPKLNVRYNIDVMNVEKNICDNVVSTLLCIDDKTKDTDKAQMHLQDMKIRKELHLVKHEDR